MNTQMKELPKLLRKSAGKNSCCIFRVPQSLVEINKEAYRPRIVSIGPYHHGNKDLEMIEEHKWRYLNLMMKRTGTTLPFLFDIIVSKEKDIRQSYSESIQRFSTNGLAKMMVLDGVFLIELFRTVGKLIPIHKDDPIFAMAWVYPYLMRDLLKIENQIPFFVLQKLFDASNTHNSTLPSLVLRFFNYEVSRSEKVLNEYQNLQGKHLLDFIRKSYISTKEKNLIVPKANDVLNNQSLKLIQPATKLMIAGAKFKASHEADSFLDIEFRNGLLLIPQINMDDFYSSFCLNCVAFEQCYSHCSKHITTYIVFMGCLMSTTTDVGMLSDEKIIENYFGTDKEIVKFFKNVGKEITFDIKKNYLSDLFLEVNEYCNNGWHVGWAGFMHTYFESPWAAISAFSALLLLFLAALQTFYTVYPYSSPKSN